MAYNSAYTGSQVDAAVGAVRQKETIWDGKQDELTGTEDQLVGFNSAGEATAVAKPTYTADDVGAISNPGGGTTGQVLTKTDGGSEWADAPDGLPSGGEEGQVLTKTASGAQWDDVPSDLPAGGTDGQILTKTADGVAWEDAPEGGVTSFNSRTGAVQPQAGDYNATQIPVSADTGAETVAAALANKAPGGYGLGSSCTTITDWNTAIKNGWYRNTTSDPGNHTPDGFAWYGFVVNYSDFLIIQVAFHADSPTNIQSAMRTCYMGTWGEWQYTTPPRSIGVEYRIPELYNNAPVYTKVINFGAAPNATSKTVGHGIASFGQCVEISGNIGGANLIGHPHITGVNVTASEITIETDADLSGSNVYVILKYTKTSS